VLLALLGTTLLTGIHQNFQLNKGDLYTLLCTLMATFHILSIQFLSRKIQDTFTFNVGQSFWAMLICLSATLIARESLQLAQTLLPWLGILFLAVPSTLIAFWFQIRAQKHLSASVASLLFLLEAPFATFFGWLLLKEHLNPNQLWGCGFILLASLLVVFLAHLQHSKKIHANPRQ
jgi:drug/metabolite transporter (DMT)-like permease